MTRAEECAAIEAYIATGRMIRITHEMVIAHNDVRVWRGRMQRIARAPFRSRKTRAQNASKAMLTFPAA
jgi:hypothetical protein